MADEDDPLPDDDDDGDGPEPVDPGEPISREALRAWLGQRPTLARAARILARRVPADLVGDLTQDAVVDALKATRMPSLAGRQAWFDRTCVRVAARHHRRRARRAPHEGPMPEAQPARDEAGLPLAGDDADAPGPSYDPEKEDFRMEGLLLRRWMERQVEGNDRDRQTYELMVDWADGDLSYAELAAARGLSPGEVHTRVFQMKKRYLPQYRKYRNGMVLLVLFGAAVAAALLYFLLRARPADEIGPDREWRRPPPPTPSASAQPQDTEFMPAGPTEDAGPDKPPLGPDKPRR